MMVSFVLSFFPRDVLDEILNLIESVSEDFPSYSCHSYNYQIIMIHMYMCIHLSVMRKIETFVNKDKLYILCRIFGRYFLTQWNLEQFFCLSE